MHRLRREGGKRQIKQGQTSGGYKGDVRGEGRVREGYRLKDYRER